MAQAAAFSDALREVAFLRRDDGVLVLLDHSDAVRATFKVQDRSLEDTDWVVTGFNNGRQAVVSVLAGTELTATFADGMVGGSGGCNRYRASFEMDGDRIRIGPAATSRRSCGSPGGVMEQEAQFLRAIESVAAAWMEGDRLELRTADGALAVSLVRAR